jgi:hypothetical protein
MLVLKPAQVLAHDEKMEQLLMHHLKMLDGLAAVRIGNRELQLRD